MSVFPVNPGTPPPSPSRIQTTQRVLDRDHHDSAPGTFRRELDRLTTPEKVNFSRHAAKRLDMRGISFTPQGIERISNAIDRAAGKDSRDSLVIAGELALVVNVPSRTVLTVMNRDSMQESIVTNIDSAVFA